MSFRNNKHAVYSPLLLLPAGCLGSEQDALGALPAPARTTGIRWPAASGGAATVDSTFDAAIQRIRAPCCDLVFLRNLHVGLATPTKAGPAAAHKYT